MRVGVLTGGGDCPGLNAVIRGIVRRGVTEYGYEFVGFRDGWRGPLEGLTMDLGIAQVRGILPRGGTILGSSRTNLVKIDGGIERTEENLRKLGIDAAAVVDWKAVLVNRSADAVRGALQGRAWLLIVNAPMPARNTRNTASPPRNGIRLTIASTTSARNMNSTRHQTESSLAAPTRPSTKSPRKIAPTR